MTLSQAHFEIIKSVEVKSVAELSIFWKNVIDDFFSERTLCLMVGPVGAGKTESLKQIQQLYDFQSAASPSFAIHLQIKNPQGKTLDHVDLFRLKDIDDLESTGFWDLFQSSKSWIFVEWADLIDINSWPLDWSTLKVEIEYRSEFCRQLTLSRLIR